MDTVKRVLGTQQRRVTIMSPVQCSAGPPEGPSSAGSGSAPSAKEGPRVVSTPPSGVPSGVRVIRVEDRDAAWDGVAARDSGEEDPSSVLKRTALLLGGDVAALLVFAAIGRTNHSAGDALFTMELLSTAGPFIAGWLLAAPILGGYGADARGSEVGPAALAAAKSWAVGIPLGLAVRALVKGYAPPVPFIGISMAATGVLLIGWRSALAAVTPKQDTSVRSRQSRKGGPLEFLKLLGGLTKRW